MCSAVCSLRLPVSSAWTRSERRNEQRSAHRVSNSVKEIDTQMTTAGSPGGFVLCGRFDGRFAGLLHTLLSLLDWGNVTE